jgi:hypothetical protein
MRWFSSRYIFVFTLFVTTNCGSQVRLISESEAVLPNASNGGEGNKRSGLLRGPKFEIVSPPSDARIESLSRIHVKFVSRNDAKLDLSTFTMTYMKRPLIDLTQRISQYTSETGVDVPKAILAPGRHVIRLEIKDVEGRSTSKLIEWNVESPRK